MNSDVGDVCFEITREKTCSVSWVGGKMNFVYSAYSRRSVGINRNVSFVYGADSILQNVKTNFFLKLIIPELIVTSVSPVYGADSILQNVEANFFLKLIIPKILDTLKLSSVIFIIIKCSVNVRQSTKMNLRTV